MVTTCRCRRIPGSGFTLLELLVVLAIASLLVALVPPLYSKVVPGARLKTFTHDFVVSLRESRALAVSGSRRVGLRLIADPPSYAVDGGPAIYPPGGIRMTAFDYIAAQRRPLNDSHAITDRDLSIRFYPDGSSNGAVVRIASGTASYRVDVSWFMGEVRISGTGDNDD